MRSSIYILFISLFFSSSLLAIVNCECGNHQTGIAAYSVAGPGCCSSAPLSGAGIFHYYQFNEGVWEYVDSYITSNQAAQAFCCTPAQGPSV